MVNHVRHKLADASSPPMPEGIEAIGLSAPQKAALLSGSARRVFRLD